MKSARARNGGIKVLEEYFFSGSKMFLLKNDSSTNFSVDNQFSFTIQTNQSQANEKKKVLFKKIPKIQNKIFFFFSHR